MADIERAIDLARAMAMAFAARVSRTSVDARCYHILEVSYLLAGKEKEIT
jgi:hypothetical protein